MSSKHANSRHPIQPAYEQKHGPLLPSRKLLIVGFAILVISVASIGAWIAWHPRSSINPNGVPAAYASQATFPVYSLTSGSVYTPVKDSFTFKDGILSFVATKDDKRILITEQSQPSDEVVERFNSKLWKTDGFTVNNFAARVGMVDISIVANIKANGTWIIISGSSYSIHNQELMELASYLKQD